MYDAEQLRCKANASKVTAEGKIDGQAFTDVNQTARPGSQANIDQPTLFIWIEDITGGDWSDIGKLGNNGFTHAIDCRKVFTAA